MNDGQANTKNGNIRTGPVRQADRATAAWLAVALAALTPALAHGETPAASAVPAAHAAANTGHKHAVLTYPGIRLSLPLPRLLKPLPKKRRFNRT